MLNKLRITILVKKLVNNCCPKCRHNLLNGNNDFCDTCEERNKELIQDIMRLSK